LPQLVEADAVVVDTRSAERFAAGHVAGTLNIPLDLLGGWAGWLLEYDRPFYLIVEPNALGAAIHALTYIGLDDVAGYFDPAALDVLAEHGVELQAYDMATPDELADDIDRGDVMLVDVRGKGEWEEGHIPGAQHYMLGYLLDTADEIINGKPIVVQCQTGVRAAIGASILQAKGARQVINMTGGYNAWKTAGRVIAN
jgi:hydroxyacylglutathione hydrolase